VTEGGNRNMHNSLTIGDLSENTLSFCKNFANEGLDKKDWEWSA
jgi:hypothetical protein